MKKIAILFCRAAKHVCRMTEIFGNKFLGIIRKKTVLKSFREQFNRGFSFIELLVVIALLSIVFAIAFVHLRNSRASVGAVEGQLATHMAMRRTIDRLTEALQDGNEVVTPPPGSTRRSLVVKTVTNQMKILFLEKKEVIDPKFLVREIYTLYSYTDALTGSYQKNQLQKVFDNIKDLTFTTMTPGLVTVHVTVTEASGVELASVVEIPLKNVGAIDE